MSVTSFKNHIVGKSHELIKYYDLGYLLNNLESLISLPIPYKDSHTSHWQYIINKEIALETTESAEQSYNNLLSEIEMRKTTFDYIRTINPDFCKDIKKHLSQDEYREYLFLLKNCSRDVTKLIASFQKKNNDYTNYKKLLQSKKDIISNIIDTEENSKLTYLQDSFVLEELKSIDESNIEPTIQENISTIKQQLEERTSKYKYFERLYESQNRIKIKPAYKCGIERE